jgi:hypothetical protein
MFRGLHLIKATRALMRTSCCDVMINVTLGLFRGEHPFGVPGFDARLALQPMLAIGRRRADAKDHDGSGDRIWHAKLTLVRRVSGRRG